MGAMIDAAGLSPLQTLRAIAAWLKSRPDNQGAENIRAQALEALEDKLRKQKAKIARLKNEAKKQDALADKVAKLELMNEADRKLRTLRTAIFEAEDAVDNAIKAGSGLPKNLAGLFPEADAILRKAFQSKKAEEAARPNRHEIGLSLTKEERAQVLKTLVDVYKLHKAPRELKSVGMDGNERYGYVYSPELFEKSDITGNMVRYYVTLPDGRIAHPTELFPNYTQAKIDTKLLEIQHEEKMYADAVKREAGPYFQFDVIDDAEAYWDDQSEKSTGGFNRKPTIFGSLERTVLTNGEKIIMVPTTEWRNNLQKKKAFIDAGWDEFSYRDKAMRDKFIRSQVVRDRLDERFKDIEAATPAPAQTMTDHTPIKGRPCTVKTAKGTRVDTVLALVEADSLIVSHDPASGAENPAFPQELQPRDRGRDSSQQWVQKTAARLDPDSLGRTSRADTGAPIIGPDRVVESGNGRSMAIQLAYQRGTADEYRQWLMDEAGYFGFEPDQVEAMRQPVLVRLRTSDIDRKAFVVEANQDDKLTFTATERAKTDAGRLNDHLIGLFAPSEDGDFTAASNQRFIQAFLQAIGDTEAAQYLTKDGKPTVALVHRLRAAVFSKAYNDDRLLEMMADQTKPEIQNVLNALSAAAPRFIDAQGYSRAGTEDVASGIVDGIEQSLDKRVVDAIVQATNTLMAARGQQQDVAEYVKQLGMFEELPEGVPELAVFLAQNGRSAKKMAIAFKAMAEFVKQDAISQQSDSLFGEPEPPRMVDVVAAANAAIEREYGPEGGAIGGLFDSAGMTPLQTLKAIAAWVKSRQAKGQDDGLSDRHTDKNYRYKDVGYVPGSKKEQAQQRMAAAKKAGQLVTVNDIDWDDLAQDSRMAEHLITKANLMGKPDWDALRADGMPGEVGYLIKRIYAAVALSPDAKTESGRRYYVRALQALRDRMEACRSYEEIKNELVSLSQEMQTYRKDNQIKLPDGTMGLTDQCYLAVSLGKKFKTWLFNTGNKALHECKYSKGSDWEWLEPSDRPESGGKPKKPRLQLEAATDIQRVGPPVKVSSTAELQAMLGLRAVQSGNYVLKDKASAEFHIQRAAEAMQDMADVTGIPVNLLGMGGRLALAFGARGKGGALAHYEPVQRVINITKVKGGGSLGHEYFHALDNMLLDLVNQKKGSASVFLSEQPHHLPDGRIKDAFVALNKSLRFGVQDTHSQITSDMWDSSRRVTLSPQVERSLENMPNKSFKSVLEYLGTVPYSGIDANGNLKSKYQIPLVLKAFVVAGLVDVGATSVPINIFPPQASSFEEMALKADDGKRGRYWSKPLEMAARAYSAYLQDRLAEQGRVSDYLAYSTQGGNGRAGEWAYPQGEERKAINAAFDQLFAAIREEQVLEKAVANKKLMDALFGVDHSEGDDAFDSAGITPLQTLRAIAAWMKSKDEDDFAGVKAAAEEAAENALKKVRARIARLKNEAKKQGALADKVGVLQKIQDAERLQRTMRNQIFDVEDAIKAALSQKDASVMRDFSSTFPEAVAIVEKALSGRSGAEVDDKQGGHEPSSPQMITVPQITGKIGPTTFPEHPDFKTYDEVQEWIAKRSSEVGLSKKSFAATHEYSHALPKIEAVYKAAKTQFDENQKERGEDALRQMADVGVKVGDTVAWTKIGAFLSQESYQGVVVMRGGIPHVKLADKITVSSSGKLRQTNYLPWKPYMLPKASANWAGPKNQPFQSEQSQQEKISDLTAKIQVLKEEGKAASAELRSLQGDEKAKAMQAAFEDFHQRNSEINDLLLQLLEAKKGIDDFSDAPDVPVTINESGWESLAISQVRIARSFLKWLQKNNAHTPSVITRKLNEQGQPFAIGWKNEGRQIDYSLKFLGVPRQYPYAMAIAAPSAEDSWEGLLAKLQNLANVPESEVDQYPRSVFDAIEGGVWDSTWMDSLADPDQTVYAVQQVPTDLISTDPGAYQWRDNTDDDGTEDRPIDPYETWDEDTPPLILHRRNDSTLWVVDGHHRLAKAERLDVPEVPAVILDEDDGYTVAAMRALCAMLNLTNEASEADGASYDPVILAGTAKHLMAMQ